MIRELLLAAARAAELLPPERRAPSPRVTAGLLLRELGPSASAHAREVLALLEQADAEAPVRIVSNPAISPNVLAFRKR